MSHREPEFGEVCPSAPASRQRGVSLPGFQAVWRVFRGPAWPCSQVMVPPCSGWEHHAAVPAHCSPPARPISCSGSRPVWTQLVAGDFASSLPLLALSG